MKHLLAFAVLLCTFFSAGARESGDSLSHVAGYIRQLVHKDNYAYQYAIKTVYPDGKESILRGTVYRNVQEFRFYSETSKDIMLLTKAGMLTINHSDKTILLKKFASDSEYLALHQRFTDSDMMGAMMDSIFTKSASLKSIKRASGHLYATLDYNPGAMLKSLDLDYALQSQQVASLTYSMNRTVTVGADGVTPDDSIEQEVKMNGFKKGSPATLTALLTPDTYTEAFLQTRYKGYQIQKL